MGKFLAWMFVLAVLLGSCTDWLDSVGDPTTSTTSTTVVTTTTVVEFADPVAPVPNGGTDKKSSSGSPTRGESTDPSTDEIDCNNPEDAIDAGWDEEDVLDYCGMDDSELESDYQDW